MVNLLFLLKPLADMLWSVKTFNLLLIACVFVFSLAHLFRLRPLKINLALLLLSLLFLRSLAADMNEITVGVFLKVVSAFLLFFLAQMASDGQKTIGMIAASFLPPVLYILYQAVTGSGYQYWGSVYTFVGPYYYKTDLAICVILSVIFFRKYLFFNRFRSGKAAAAVYMFVIAPQLILMANSRMLLIVYAVILIGTIVEYFRYKERTFSSWKRNAIVVYSLLLIVAGYALYVNFYLPKGALVIEVQSGEIFSASNTQGRSEIWSSIAANYFKGDLLNLAFGYSINKDHEFDTVLHADAHNAWLKVMVSCGLVGLFVYMAAIGMAIGRLRGLLRDRLRQKSDYFVLMTALLVLLSYLFSGISQSNIIFTQSSWYAFYFMGLIFNPKLFPLSAPQAASPALPAAASGFVEPPFANRKQVNRA
ncbi:hypothetical protein [Cohnella hongkongensis]|uniref:O-antigen ligase domain-containing protein n=1 Tax=Cohnella hongkongensis TaxID=178337 RepID=A0ABV9F8V0_9BACL